MWDEMNLPFGLVSVTPHGNHRSWPAAYPALLYTKSVMESLGLVTEAYFGSEVEELLELGT